MEQQNETGVIETLAQDIVSVTFFRACLDGGATRPLPDARRMAESYYRMLVKSRDRRRALGLPLEDAETIAYLEDDPAACERYLVIWAWMYQVWVEALLADPGGLGGAVAFAQRLHAEKEPEETIALVRMWLDQHEAERAHTSLRAVRTALAAPGDQDAALRIDEELVTAFQNTFLFTITSAFWAAVTSWTHPYSAKETHAQARRAHQAMVAKAPRDMRLVTGYLDAAPERRQRHEETWVKLYSVFLATLVADRKLALGVARLVPEQKLATGLFEETHSAMAWWYEHLSPAHKRSVDRSLPQVADFVPEARRAPTTLVDYLRQGVPYDLGASERPSCFFPECLAPESELAQVLTLPVPGDQHATVTVCSCPEHREWVLSHIGLPHMQSHVQAYMTQYRASARDAARSVPPPSGTQDAQGVVRALARTAPRTPPRYSSAPQLIERFRVRQLWSNVNADALSAVKELYGERAVDFLDAYTNTLIDLALKYRFAPSASDLAQELCAPTGEHAVLRQMLVGADCLWIEFEQPIETPRGQVWAFSYATKSLKHFQYARQQAPIPERVMEELYWKITKPEWASLGLDASNERGDAIWTLSVDIEPAQGKRAMRVVNYRRNSCPSGGCTMTDEQYEGFPQVIGVCDDCLATDGWFLSFYSVLLRLINGEIATTEERERFFVKTEQSVRKVPDPKKPWKFHEQRFERQYHLVTFDVATKVRRVRSDEDRESGRRGTSWVEGLDPDQILYVDKHIGETARRLRHPRYHKWIERMGTNLLMVRAHEKRIPMKLETVKTRIARVVAKERTS